MIAPMVHHPATSARLAVMAWQWERAVGVLSSAAVGDGLGEIDWLLNIGVPRTYDRTDLDTHSAEVASEFELKGAGAALFTAADLDTRQRSEHDGVVLDATVGISKPTWAADPSGGFTFWQPGTINLVIHLPVPLAPSAAVNAVITATEAKTQALVERGIPGTGTASDAVAVVWPLDGPPTPFAGPRSEWGARIAQATHTAVLAGLAMAGSRE